jgi:tetratricopeptide (TPR) repeat protein
MEDLAKLQKEIANKVTQQLKFKLTGEEVEKLSNSTSTNPEAFQALLKGRHHWRKRGEKGLETAIEFFEKAIRIDPNYALAWSGLADSYSIIPAYTRSMLPRDAMPKARAAAENAVRLGPNLAEAHVSLGKVLVAQFRTAVELEPLAIVINRNFADTLYRIRSYRKAEAQYKKVLEIDPESARTLRRLGTMLAFRGRFKEAFAALNESAALGDEGAKIKLGIARVLEGNEKKAREILAIESKRAVHSPATLAALYAILGERERAFELIDRSTEESSVEMSRNIRSPEFDNLREDSRFERAVLRMGLPVK